VLNERIASDVGRSHIDIAYEQRGNPAHPTVLLVMGIAAQLVHWPLGFLDALVQRSLHIVRFDNRDAGRSTHLRAAPPADLPAALRGDLSSASYTLSDMAADAVGLLDVLGVDAAHVVGASLGVEGMGHNLPRGLWERIADHIAEVVRRGESSSRP
jgi:pimeloyl-ACP methyl ester carboxylesterase